MYIFLMSICSIFPILIIIMLPELIAEVGLLLGLVGGGGILLLFSIPLILVYRSYLKSKKEDVKQKQKMTKIGALRMLRCQHVDGLPIPKDAYCILYLCKNEIMIEYNNKLYKLGFDKIVDIYADNSTNISKHYVSSAGGAVAGGILFGAVGAAIGGRTKTKYEIESKEYLGITKKEGKEYSYILMGINILTKKEAEEIADYVNDKINCGIVEI